MKFYRQNDIEKEFEFYTLVIEAVEFNSMLLPLHVKRAVSL